MEAGPVPVGQARDRLAGRLVGARFALDLAARATTPSLTEGHPTTHAPPRRARGPVASHGVRVSTRGDYASRALLSLALHGAEMPTSVKDIAVRTGLPQPYLEQILLALKGAGLVRSKRGVGGGYVLARPPRRSPWPGSSPRSTARSPPATSGSPTRTGPATTRGSASCWPSGRRRGDHPHAPAVLQPGRHGRPGSGDGGGDGLSRPFRFSSPQVPGLDRGPVELPAQHRTAPVRNRKSRPATGAVSHRPSERAGCARAPRTGCPSRGSVPAR